jgi:hypothetical protein
MHVLVVDVGWVFCGWCIMVNGVFLLIEAREDRN